MNKKLICLTLSILMLLACVFTSCSSKKNVEDDEEDTVDNSAKTITMWLIGQDVPTVDELPEKVRESIEPAQKKDADGNLLFVDEAKTQPLMETYEEAADRVCRAELKKAQDAVQTRFAAMTKSKFKTDVILKFCTEDEYYEALEEAIKENQRVIELEAEYSKALRKYMSDQKKENEENKKKDTKTFTIEFHALPENKKYAEFNPYDPNNNIVIEDEENDAPETDVYTENEDGVKEILYPEAKANQVDIFYIGNVEDGTGKTVTGYDKYMQYYENDWLSSLNEELTTSSKKLESYISTSLLKGVEIDGVKYAIPNNVAIGEYTYMFIDKEIFDKYYHKIDSVKDVTSLGIFLNDIMYENEGKNPSDSDYIVPLASSFEECIKMLTWYWNINYTDSSVYETYFDEETGRNYVVQREYEMSEGGDDGSKSQTAWIDVALDNQLYKTNEDGLFLDVDGNVLPYKYAIDSSRVFVLDEYGDVSVKEKANSRSLYLVDENGDPVTPENDKRVIITPEFVEQTAVYETHYDEASGRIYVVKVQAQDEDGKDILVDAKADNQIYKVNSKGQYLDADGNILDFVYEIDDAGYWLKDENGKVTYVEQEGSESLYLVHNLSEEELNEIIEKGEEPVYKPVKSYEDDRVVRVAEISADGATKNDAYTNVLPTYKFFIDEDADFSILGTLIKDPSLRNRGSINMAFTSLFTDKGYRDLYATLKDYDYKGYYGTPAVLDEETREKQKAAVSFVEGDARILQDYNAAMEKLRGGIDPTGFVYDAEVHGKIEDDCYIQDGKAYYVVVAEYPVATEDELYGNMYAVYSNSNYLSRAMKVITYLNTNSEMRDLLQYGVEGYHYERNDDGTVTRLSHDDTYGTYYMDIKRTGNCFIASPTAEDGGADAWTYAKIQNNESLINPLLGFDFNTATADSDYTLDVQLIDYIKQLNDEASALINDCTSKEDLVILMTDAENGFMNIYTAAGATNKDKMKKALSNNYDPSSPAGENAEIELPPDTSGSSPYTVYYEWLTEFKYLPSTTPVD